MASNRARLLSEQFDRLEKERKKSGLEADFKKWQDVYDGEQKLPGRFLVGRSRANTVTNITFAQIEVMKAILSQNVPVSRLTPVMKTEPWLRIAELITKMIDRIFLRNDMKARMSEAVHQMLLRGKGYFKATWDPSLNGGHGEVKIRVPDTKQIYMEPGKPLVRDSNMVFEATSVDPLTLIRSNPDRIDEIKQLMQRGRTRLQRFKSKFVRESEKGFSPTAADEAASTETVPFFQLLADMGEELDQSIRLIEGWFHDDETMESMLEIIDPKKGTIKKVKGEKKRFPNGMFAQFSHDVMFEERQNRFPGFPYIELFNYVGTGQNGVSEIKHIRDLQKQYNLRNNQLFDIMAGQLSPVIFAGARSGLDKDMYDNSPHPIIEVTDARDIQIVPPPRVGDAHFESMSKIERQIEFVTGVPEVTRGLVPEAVRSGAAIEALQEAADVRLKGKTINIESAVRQLVRFLIPMMTRFYNEGEHFALESDMLKTDEYRLWKQGKIHADFFDIEVEAGVNRPRSRIASEQKQQWMFANEIIDEEYVVQHTQLDDKDDLIERMKPIWEAKRQARLSPGSEQGVQ